MDRLNKPELQFQKSSDDCQKPTSTNTLTIPASRIRTSLEVPGRFLDVCGSKSYDRQSSNSINRGVHTITIGRPQCKHPMYRNKKIADFKSQNTAMTVNKEHVFDMSKQETKPSNKNANTSKKIKQNKDCSRSNSTVMDSKSEKDDNEKKDTFEDVMAHVEYANYLNNEHIRSVNANKCGVYKRMLASDKWKKNKVKLPSSRLDPLDVANQPIRHSKGTSYRQCTQIYQDNLQSRNQYIAYLPCKEMPYGFFSSEKTGYPYNSKHRLRHGNGSSSSSQFPVIDLSEVTSLDSASDREGDDDEDDDIAGGSGVTGNLKKNMNSESESHQ